MFKSDNSFGVFIGKSISRTASVQVYDPANTTTFLANGEVVVVGADGNVLTAGQTVADSEFIRIAQGRGTSADSIISNKIFGADVTHYKGVSYQAPAEQISYVGYNGSSGAIEAISGNTYKLRVTFNHDSELWSEQKNIIYNEYTSDSSATASEIAAGFVKKYNNTYPANNADIKVERVCDGTFTVAGGATTATVTNGSKTVTFSGSGHNFAVGDVIRIGGATGTYPVFLVAAVSGATVTLDSAYQGTSGTVANANIGEMSSITSWGLKFTGKALTFSVGLFKYIKVAFDVTLQDFGTTTVTDSQTASRGNGTYEEVAELEYFALGFDGWLSTRNSVPAVSQPRTDATSGATYDIITIKGYDRTDFGAVSGIKPSPFTIIIAMVDGAAQTTNLLAQLNPWMASTPKSFANVAV